MPDAQITIDTFDRPGGGTDTYIMLVCWPNIPMDGKPDILDEAIIDMDNADCDTLAATIDAIRHDDLWEDFTIDPDIADYR